MNKQNRLALSLTIAVTLGGSLAASAGPHPIPEGMTQYIVAMATGVFDPFEPHPVVPDCGLIAPGLCNGLYFQTVIMGRTPAEIADEISEAKELFRTRFGMDVDAPENFGRLFLAPIMFDPRQEYRAYSVGGERTPPEGWVIRDGGFIGVVIDPAGFTLGGEFLGVHVPAGSAVLYGNYNILITNPAGKPKREIVIRYRAGRPVIPAYDGLLPFQCELEHAAWQAGRAQGISHLTPNGDGTWQANTRNIMTFPAAARPTR